MDIENLVFDTVATSLRSAYAGIFVTGETINAPSIFPAVSIVEMDSASYLKTMTGLTENHSTLMYQAEVVSNLPYGRKAQCKEIMNTVDAQMLAMGFIRLGKSPLAIPSGDTTVYRMVARYKGISGVSIDAEAIQIYGR